MVLFALTFDMDKRHSYAGAFRVCGFRFVHSSAVDQRCAAPAPGAVRIVAACPMVRRIVALQRVPGAADVRAAALQLGSRFHAGIKMRPDSWRARPGLGRSMFFAWLPGPGRGIISILRVRTGGGRSMK